MLHIRVVRVEWEDIQDFSDWEELPKALIDYKPPICITYGRFVKDDGNYLVLALHNCPTDGSVASMTVIPKGTIKKIETIYEEDYCDKENI